MEKERFYQLPALPYEDNALEPYISQSQLLLHHDMHHKAYVDNANKILEKLDHAKNKGEELNFGSLFKELSFNVGGHVLHSLYWENMTPEKGTEAGDGLEKAINRDFGHFDRFFEEFTQTALKVEGSGWAALAYCKKTKRLLIMQIEKHNVNVIPDFKILLVMDVWEHAYYLDYENRRTDYIKSFWEIVNWDAVNKRYKEIVG